MPVSAEHVPEILLLCNLADVGDTQRRAVVAVELATHLLAAAHLAAQMRGHVSSASYTKATRATRRVVRHVGGRVGALGGHGVLEGTFCCEMVSRADTALDLCVLELQLLLVLIALVVLRGLPVGLWAEDNVLSNRNSVGLGPGGLALLLAEFCPCLALSHAGVHDLLDDCLLDAARRLDLLAVLVYAVGYDRLGSVLVFGDCLLGEGEIVLIFLFGPVGAAANIVSDALQPRKSAERTLLLETWLRCDVRVRVRVREGVGARRASWAVDVGAIQRWSGVWGRQMCDDNI